MAGKLIVALAAIALLMHFEVGHSQDGPDETSSETPSHYEGAALRDSHDETEVLSPDKIVQNKIEGPVRVEFVVESLIRYTGTSTEKEWPMNFKLMGVKAGNDEFNVEIAGEVFRRLHELGIEDGPEEVGKHDDVAVHRHFVGKTVRVNGTVKLYPKDGSRVLCWLRIENLDQIESVRRQ